MKTFMTNNTDWARDLLNEEQTQTDWMVDGLIAKDSFNVIASETGVGRSWLSMIMAYNISEGIDFFGQKTKKSKVLLIDMHMSRQMIIGRLKRICKDMKEEKNLAIRIPRGDKNNIGKEENYQDLVETAKKYDVVILDCFDQIHTCAENDGGQIGDIIDKLKALDTTVIVTHILRKPGVMRGSSAISTMADNVLMVTGSSSTRDTRVIDDKLQAIKNISFYNAKSRHTQRPKRFDIKFTWEGEESFDYKLIEKK